MDVDFLVEQFLQNQDRSIRNVHKTYYKTDNQISFLAFREGLVPELKSGCFTFLDKNLQLEELPPYLFYIVNAYAKKNAFVPKQYQKEYVCPGCLYLGKTNIINYHGIFKCHICASQIDLTPEREFLFKTFAIHNKSGYHCYDCGRFIPKPLMGNQVSCPYLDCIFVGDINKLRKMHHPQIKVNPEKLVNVEYQISVPSIDYKIKEEFVIKFNNLKEIIDNQKNTVSYSSADSTLIHKRIIYQAIDFLLEEHPLEMVEYLSAESNSYNGFQHKIFQKYIELLEKELPFVIRKNKKIYKISSLLDKSLCLFDGISVFESIIEKNIIKNKTQEFYIGGRKAAYTKPYYIGKLLNVINKKTKQSYIPLIKEYSFNKIWLKNVEMGNFPMENIPVIVSHLRVPPHYQMGGMAYVNRIRRKIVDRIKGI